MKKLAFVFAAVVAVSFASCGGNKTEQGCCADSDSVAVEELCCDTVCCDSACCDSAAAPVAD